MLVQPAATWAAPTEFSSPEYMIGGVIFGGTGTLRFPSAVTPPAILTGPSVADVTTTSARISWTTDRATTGTVFVGTVAGSYLFQVGESFAATTSSHSVLLEFLTKNTVYYYKVRSTDVYGNAVESTESSFISDIGDITPPVITEGPIASQTSANQVVVTWITDEVSSTIVEYGIQSADQNSAGRTDERTLFHQVTLSGLVGQQTYFYRVKSTDDAGNTVTSGIFSFTTVSSPSITDVRVTDVTLNSAVVQWRTGVPASTTIRFGTTRGSYSQVIQDTNLSESHLVRLSGLVSGTEYYFQLMGTDGSGTVLTSDEYIFKTIILPTIRDIEIVQIESRSAVLRWRSSSEVDAFVRYEIVRAPDERLNGRRFATGDDRLSLEHVIQLEDLESDTVYSVTALGKDIFGNQAISPTKTFRTLLDNEPPIIENVRTDTTIDLGSRQTVQVLVSFGLSEPSMVYIEYGEGATGGYTKKITPDDIYSRNKFMVIPSLVPGNSYHFRIVATDRAGNVTYGEDYLVLAPAQPVSLLDLIFGQIRSNFGWLQNLR
jgi:hypothetical protein